MRAFLKANASLLFLSFQGVSDFNETSGVTSLQIKELRLRER